MATETKLRRVMTKYVADAGDHVYAANQVAKATELVSLGFEAQAEKASTLKQKWDELSKGMVGLELHDLFKGLSDGTKDATGGMVDLQAAFAGFKAAGPIGALLGLHGAAVKLLEVLPSIPGGVHDLTVELDRHVAAARADKIAWEQTDEALRRVNITFFDQRKLLTDINFQLQVGAALRKANTALGAYGRGQGVGLQGVAGTIGDGAAGSRGIGDVLDVKTQVNAWAEELKKLANAQAKSLTDALVTQLEADIRRGGAKTSLSDIVSPSQVDDQTFKQILASANGLNAQGNAVGGYAQRYNAHNDQKNQSFLESTFGPLDEFNGYKTAFDGLSSSVVAGFDAMVDGTQSFGAAFKHAIADALKSAGAEMAVMALKETAYGVASLALGPIGGVSAAGHFKAAGLFALGAAAAGIAAHGLGTSAGAGGASSSSSAPQTYKSPSGGQGGQAGTPIIVYGDSFYEDSPRGRARTARRVVTTVLGNSAVRPS